MKLDPERVHTRREQLGLSIVEVAENAEVSPNSVSRAENNREIRPLTARRIARALGVEVADLYPKGAAPTPSTSLPKAEADGERRVTDIPHVEFVRTVNEANSDELIDLYYRLDAERARAELVLREDEANHSARSDYLRAVERRMQVFLRLLARDVTLPDLEQQQLTRQVEQLEKLQLLH